MIQVPSHDGKKTKANLSKYPLSRQFFPRCNTIDTTKSAQQKRRFSPCFYPSARKTQYATASHMHIQRGTEKIPVNFFFLRPVKICLAFDNRSRLHSQHFGALYCLTPFPVPRRLSPPRFPDLPDGSIPARTLQLAAMPRLTPLDELPSRRFCALKFSFLFRF